MGKPGFYTAYGSVGTYQINVTTSQQKTDKLTSLTIPPTEQALRQTLNEIQSGRAKHLCQHGTYTITLTKAANQTIKLQRPLVICRESPIILDLGGAILDGQHQTRHFLLTGNMTTFTLKNGTLINGKSQGIGGGAIRLDSQQEKASLSLDHLQFRHNQTTSSGGAIFAIHSQVQLINCLFEANQSLSNHPSAGGGAIRTEASTIILKQCQFSQNKASKGSAIYCRNGQLKDQESTYQSNQGAPEICQD